ncbi:hypothetical protein BDZ91DRAFT_713869 [Kalaharituber pfeilii]|nr:hypothetical protein BDZ91DRAFT_713869 [Kalaharituber pfeilii]
MHLSPPNLPPFSSDLPANPACLLLPVVLLFLLVACEFCPLPPPPAASHYPTLPPIRSTGFIFSSHSKKPPLNKAMFYPKIARLSIGSYHC